MSGYVLLSVCWFALGFCTALWVVAGVYFRARRPPARYDVDELVRRQRARRREG